VPSTSQVAPASAYSPTGMPESPATTTSHPGGALERPAMWCDSGDPDRWAGPLAPAGAAGRCVPQGARPGAEPVPVAGRRARPSPRRVGLPAPGHRRADPSRRSPPRPARPTPRPAPPGHS
jgi:hypothetical protein